MALLWRLFTLTTASLGYTRSLREVMGTTCTRFKYLFAASLLMMTAGRFLRISPATDGSKFTHQTSPRLIAHVPDGDFCPFESFQFARLILAHFLICRLKIGRQDMGSNEIFNEAADPPPTHYVVEPFVHLLVQGDR